MVALLADTEDNVVYLAGNKHEFSFVKMRVPLSVCVRVYALRIVSRDKILRFKNIINFLLLRQHGWMMVLLSRGGFEETSVWESIYSPCASSVPDPLSHAV